MSAGDMSDLKGLIGRVAGGTRLDAAEAEQAFDIIMSGDATPAQMGGFLMALRVRGETVDEITGGVQAMRDKMTGIAAPPGAIDIVGTGGDAKGTLNVSTTAALVTAACGVTVAKHGNRALSSKTGAADVLGALGVNLDAPFPRLEQALAEAGICFMLAPRHHGAMRNVAGTRVELGTRTIFNLLGPMSNPAGVKRQLIGVFGRAWLQPMAETMRNLGSETIWVVHGSDGTDELTITGPTYVARLENGEITEAELHPADAGLEAAPFDAIKGGDPEHNAQAVRALLDGKASAFRDMVLFNVAAALMIAGNTRTLPEGVAIAAAAIDSGKAKRTLETLAAITNLADPEAE
jgi:anthranilate phosphoribosyltransferase